MRRYPIHALRRPLRRHRGQPARDPAAVPHRHRLSGSSGGRGGGPADVRRRAASCCATARRGRVETLHLGTHSSTHLDAPWHYNSQIAGVRSQTIDELPLEWFHAPGRRARLHRQGRRRRRHARAGRGRAGAGRPRAQAARHRARAHRPRRALRHPRVPGRGAGRDRRGHPVALRARCPRDGHRRLGLGPAAAHAGRGGAPQRRARRLLGGASGRVALLADRAPGRPRRAAADGLHRELLPAAGRGRERGAQRASSRSWTTSSRPAAPPTSRRRRRSWRR